MKKLISIIFYVIAVLLLIMGIYMTGLHIITSYLIGQGNMGMVLESMKSQLPVWNIFGSYSLLVSGLLFIITGILVVLIIRKLRK